MQLPPPARLGYQRRGVGAYPALPGTGPEGKTCGDCDNAYMPARPNPKSRFWKCRLVEATHGRGTDIRVRSPACSKFQPNGEPE